jgi:drug/metabolite transporter (DMT)-like permease
VKLIGIVLLVVGILALVYRGFSYSHEKGDAKIGPVEIQVTEKKHVDVPVWAGIGAVVVGAALMALKPRG